MMVMETIGYGGAGYDYLEGSAGNDTYIWGRGYGHDTINNVVKNYYVIEGGAYKLQLTEGLNANDFVKQIRQIPPSQKVQNTN